jgi:hypothetical protein
MFSGCDRVPTETFLFLPFFLQDSLLGLTIMSLLYHRGNGIPNWMCSVISLALIAYWQRMHPLVDVTDFTRFTVQLTDALFLRSMMN